MGQREKSNSVFLLFYYIMKAKCQNLKVGDKQAKELYEHQARHGESAEKRVRESLQEHCNKERSAKEHKSTIAKFTAPDWEIS
jgi:hypothetical protein